MNQLPREFDTLPHLKMRISIDRPVSKECQRRAFSSGLLFPCASWPSMPCRQEKVGSWKNTSSFPAPITRRPERTTPQFVFQWRIAPLAKRATGHAFQTIDQWRDCYFRGIDEQQVNIVIFSIWRTRLYGVLGIFVKWQTNRLSPIQPKKIKRKTTKLSKAFLQYFQEN